MLLDPSRSVLLLIDVQERLAPAMADAAAVVDRCVLLLRAAARLGVPVLTSEQYPKGLGRTLHSLRELIDGQPIVAKTSFACTGEPDWQKALDGLGRDQAVIAGMEAHVCVLQTALALIERSTRVAVVADAVGSRRHSDRDLALARMARAGAEIVSSEMVVFEWLGQAGTPEFKELSALVR